MSDAVNWLLARFGSHEKVAEILGYTPRNYRKIRRKIEKDAPRKPMQSKPESTIAHSAITPPTAQSPQSSGPRIVNSAKESFPDPRKMSLEDGI